MKKEYVIIIVVAALALIWWFFFRNQPATTTATTTQTPGATSAAPVTQAAVVNGPPSANATATGASQTLTQTDVVSSNRPSTGVNPVGITPVDSSQFDPVILPWINSFGAANKQHALDMYPQFTAAEKSMLVDFITNLWPGKRSQTQTDTANWNAWRTKYHILDGTYSPFDGAQDPYLGSNGFDNSQDAYVTHDIDPLTPVSGSQTANNFKEQGAGSTAYNGLTGGKKLKVKGRK